MNHAPQILQSIKEVLADMPEQPFVDGGTYNWGPHGNKSRAVYLASVLGHNFDINCPNCESDLLLVLRNHVKREANGQG